MHEVKSSEKKEKMMFDDLVIYGKGKKKKNLNFDDVVVEGKYHAPIDPITAGEEDDSILDILLKGKKDFKDRIRRSTDRL